MQPITQLPELIEFWKKTQKINIALLNRIAVQTEMSCRILTEILTNVRDENLTKIDAWYRQEYKKTQQGLRDLIFRDYGELDISELFHDDELK
jgi:hypothetical protein